MQKIKSLYKEYQKLIEQINKHDLLYFVIAKPEIADYEYDQLVKKAEAIERSHPEFVSKNTPTNKIKGDFHPGFKQIVHSEQMLSLTNTYSEGEIVDFIKRMHKLLGSKEICFTVELKMDGVAASIRYEKGVLTQGVTRGDGKQGDDVTENVKTITNLPHVIKSEDLPEILELRGEIYLSLDVFAKLNYAKTENGEDPYANPRNAAAGSLKLLDPNEAKKRKLSIMIYDVISNNEITKQSQIAQYLHKFGIPAFPKKYSKVCSSLEEIMKFIHYVENDRETFPFEIDGVVIKLDDLKDRKIVGVTGKSPRWAIAYKFASAQATTIIENITVQVGRSGVLTPVAELKPVRLAGSTISRATLHNREEIERKDIRIGDTVIVEKGGDVIPKIASVDLNMRKNWSIKWNMPTKCPSCGSSVINIEGEVAVKCVNKMCKSKHLRRLMFFVAKGAMNIDHIGDKVLAKLLENGFVQKISDIYRLTKAELTQIEGFKDKSICNLLNSIERSKKTTLSRLIFSLGIHHIGASTAAIIADYVKEINNLINITYNELLTIDGVGPKAAESVIDFFSNQSNVREVYELIELGVKPELSVKQKNNHSFYNKMFVLTGKLPHYTRLEATELIVERGGHVGSSVSSKTDFVLVGDESGSKLANAEKLGVKIITESEFVKLLDRSD